MIGKVGIYWVIQIIVKEESFVERIDKTYVDPTYVKQEVID